MGTQVQDKDNSKIKNRRCVMAYGAKPAGKSKPGTGPYGSTGGPAYPSGMDKGSKKKPKKK